MGFQDSSYLIKTPLLSRYPNIPGSPGQSELHSETLSLKKGTEPGGRSKEEEEEEGEGEEMRRKEEGRGREKGKKDGRRGGRMGKEEAVWYWRHVLERDTGTPVPPSPFTSWLAQGEQLA